MVIPPAKALPHLPALPLSPDQCAAIRQGRAIRHSTPVEPDAFVRLLDPSGALLAIGIARKEGIYPKRVIAT
ncbi:MAG: hypothetical protein D6812_08080 [Deltaproteobacteria bacterium]|nr:MAG: hypothetical protein D6812_08080 [Deltaproteobacteria bacterium]